MFGKKTSNQHPSSQRDDVVVHTIPEMFYGGKNPEIYNNKQEHLITKKQPILKHIKKNPLSKTKSFRSYLFIGVGILLLFIIIGVGWFFLNRYLDESRIGQNTNPTPPIITTDTSSQVQPVQDVSNTVTTTFQITTPNDIANNSDILFSFPSLGLFDSVDLDADGVTDVEEGIYGTDPGMWDTDTDGYYDGLELDNLYSPTQIAPIKIRATAVVQEYTNPQFGYRLYHPTVWQVASVDTEGKQVLISTPTGEYIEIIHSNKLPNEMFVDWYARVIGSSARFTDFVPSTNRFSFDYLHRPDKLAAFFESSDAVFTLIYHTNNNQVVVYRRTMGMLLQSFVPFGTAAPLPEQDILPPTSGTTTP